MDMAALVEQRVSDEKARAENIAGSIGVIEQHDLDASFMQFFREVVGPVPGGRWSNLPLSEDGASVPLAHYLLLGVPPVLDLSPVGRDQFESAHGITIEAVEHLAEQRRVILNLYDRGDPQRWRDHHHLSSLVRKSFVCGVRVDRWFDALSKGTGGPPVEERRVDGGRMEAIGRAIEASSTETREQISKLARQTDAGAISRLVCRQWAHLEVMNQQAAQHFAALVDESRIADALVYGRIMRRQCVSPYTAALGGDLVWGPFDLAQYDLLQYDPVVAPTRQFTAVERLICSTVPEAWRYLVEELAALRPYQLARPRSVDTLLDALDNDELTAQHGRIWDTLHELTRLANQGLAARSKTAELRDLVAQEEKLLRAFELVGTGAVWLATETTCYGLGTVLGQGLLGTIVGGVVCALDPGHLGAKLGAGVHGMVHPDRHRMLANLRALKPQLGS